MKSAPEELLAFQLKAAKIHSNRQFKAISGRGFLFDFVCYSQKETIKNWLIQKDVLVEVQGGIWLKKSGHNTGIGLTRDCEKLSLAAVAGYRVICVTPAQIKSGQALQWITEALK